MQYSKPEFAPL